MYLDGAVKARGRSTAFWGVRAASPAERKQKNAVPSLRKRAEKALHFWIFRGMQTEPAHSAARHAP